MATEKTILVGITEITGITEMEITEMEITVMVTAIPKPEVLIMDQILQTEVETPTIQEEARTKAES